MEASTGAPAPPFKIVSQVHEPDYSDPANAGALKWTVTFRTSSGDQASVTVPDAEYNAENVARLIIEKVRHMEAVRALGTLP